jgi:FlaA1/EpsC-like NDP-sugar epimerase
MVLNRRSWILFLIHSVTVCMALVLAWLLRFDFTLPHLRLLLSALPILVVIRWAGMYCCKLTHSHWRYTGIGDLKDLLKAVLLGSLVFFTFLRWVCGASSFPG